ncbi:kinase-like domain-containing protein [Neohortaea acidophila]|uniref:Kinase-like domain-containing protein n=1 Tax=Neohortaea acidophila TaxID=245834 RepID=A0A6A6PZZ2_9PEZI|nr:kinase-like domain-containing protein [Neohortaea acidophila]KAF2485314.1 kinase-like domain-containing protein [Neohortaea acidophila]
MHFRDNSKREKFFVTYAETATKWRRLAISLDYRNAPEGSLEEDTLDDIHFYNTVTNLRLVTTPEDGQLHVHVREDVNEIVEYPSLSLLQHVRVPLYRESDVEFVSHLSGFVYEVNVDGDHLIKKEIPGPDTIDEFLYEVNALDALFDSENVIKLRGLVTDEIGTVVKGLLISYATHGALVDVIFADQGTPALPWHRREKWAKQIVQGLSDIHEAGFVQGDFTLSNVVIDGDDNAQIIDINRRGCPVGWEPPELHRLIRSGQRISMCIGVKTDLFQLGMVLWALAQQIDDPDLQERPLARLPNFVPPYFRDIVETCLSERPQDRWSARILLDEFPTSPSRPSHNHLSL